MSTLASNILILLLALLIHTGPLLPACGALAFRRAVKRSKLPMVPVLSLLGLVHVLAYVPRIIAMIAGWPDAIKGLIFPCLTGLISLLVGASMVLSAIAVHWSSSGREAIERNGDPAQSVG